MKNWFLTLVVLPALGLALPVASIAGLHVRAQVVTKPTPFVATLTDEMESFVKGDGPVPLVKRVEIAVRSDGSLVRLVTLKPNQYLRTIVDTTARTTTVVDDLTHSRANGTYVDKKAFLKGWCPGSPSDAILGYQTLYLETKKTLPVVNQDGSSDGTQHTEISKVWRVPDLGCFQIQAEHTDWHGDVMQWRTTQKLTNIKVGEPDAWYFAVPMEYKLLTEEALFAQLQPLVP